MNRALWKKAIRESYLLFLGCSSILYLFCSFHVWFNGKLEMGRFKKLVDNLPDFIQNLSPVPLEQLFSYEARVSIAYEEPVVYLMMAVWTIARSSDAVSGKLGRGTMEMLLAQPISRRQVIATHTAVTLIGALLLAIIALAGTTTGINTAEVLTTTEPSSVFGVEIPFTGGQESMVPMYEVVAPETFIPAALNYFSLGVFLTGFTTLMSSWDRYRWRTIGIAVGFYVISTILELLGTAVAGLSWVKNLTFFSAYEPIRFVCEAVQDPQREWALLVRDSQGVISELGPLGYDFVLIGLGLVGIITATIVFCRRDLPAPL